MGLYKTPNEATQSIVAYGVTKGRHTLTGHLIIRAFMAGAFIGFGGLFAIIAAGGLDPAFRTAYPGIVRLLYGFVFPVGLVAVVLEGAELFTSNVMYLSAAVLERKASLLDLLKNWILSWIFNFCGTLFVAGALVYVPDLLGGPTSSFTTFIVGVAHKKVETPFGHLVLKAIGCNWLVCLAVCAAITAESVEGKIMGIYLPIWAFVAVGFEHSVANMFFIPVAMFYSPETISVGALFSCLLPVTIGNILGGACFVALPSWYLLPSSGPFAHSIPAEPIPLLPRYLIPRLQLRDDIESGQQSVNKVVPSATAPTYTMDILETDADHHSDETVDPMERPTIRQQLASKSPTAITLPLPNRRESETPNMIMTGLALGLTTQALQSRATSWGHAPGGTLVQRVPAGSSGDVDFLEGLTSTRRTRRAGSVSARSVKSMTG